jgi:type I site-specific restriction endonuclease
MALLNWFGQMWSKLAMAAESNEDSSAMDGDSQGCQIFTDAIEQKCDELDKLTADIFDLTDELWRCRERQSASESVGTEDPLFQRFQTAAYNKNEAQALLKTSASRVRQVVAEIDSIGRTE